MSRERFIPPGPTCQPTQKTEALVAAWIDAGERRLALAEEHEIAMTRAEARLWQADAALADHLKDELGLPSEHHDDQTGVVVGDLLLHVRPGRVPYQEGGRPRVWYYRIAGRA